MSVERRLKLTLSYPSGQPLCARHEIHLIHPLDTPSSGWNPIGITLTYTHYNKLSTLLVLPSAFRHIIQTLPPDARQARVSLNTFQYEFQADNLVDLNGWVIRLPIVTGQSPIERLALATALLKVENKLFTHYCYTQNELSLIWLTLPVHKPPADVLEQFQQAFEESQLILSELSPLRENALMSTLPLDTLSCHHQTQSQDHHGAA